MKFGGMRMRNQVLFPNGSLQHGGCGANPCLYNKKTARGSFGCLFARWAITHLNAPKTGCCYGD